MGANLLATVKTAALVEANSADYVIYLHNVFADDGVFRAAADRWGEEEAQHGAALGRWAELVDPTFSFSDALATFRAGYSLPLQTDQSVRGSRAGELLARCVVESGTCSFYSAMRDASSEPVLRQICGLIAQDEAQHYRLFETHYHRHPGLTLWRRLRVALGRVVETGDDELAYAFYSANRPHADAAYDRDACGRAYQRLATGLYRYPHVRTVVHMIARAIGFNPARRGVRASGRLAWWLMRANAGRGARDDGGWTSAWS